jgi:hypothetical protein
MLNTLKDNIFCRFLGFFSFFLLFFSFQQINNWPLLRYWNIRGRVDFWDANAVLQFSDCFSQISFSVYLTAIDNPCHGYMYGSNLLWELSFLGIGANESFIVGWIFLILLSIAFGILSSLIRPEKYFTIFAILLVFISPPILLLVERANFDSLIFIILLLATLVYSRRGSLLGLLLIAQVSLWKFYTYPLALFWVTLLHHVYLKLLGVLILFTVLCQTFTDYKTAQALREFGLVPPISIDGANTTFGIQIWGEYLEWFGIKVERLLGLCLGIALFALTYIVVKLFNKKLYLVLSIPTSPDFRERVAFRLFQFSYIVFASCYFVALNFDYRLIFLSASVVGFLLIGESKSKRSALEKVVLTLTIAAFWLSYNAPRFQPIGDIAISFLVCLLGLTFLKITFLDNPNSWRIGKLFQRWLCKLI